MCTLMVHCHRSVYTVEIIAATEIKGSSMSPTHCFPIQQLGIYGHLYEHMHTILWKARSPEGIRWQYVYTFYHIQIK